MSNIFSGKTTSEEKIEADYLGSGGVFDTDIYKGTIKYAYMMKAQNSKAQSFNLIVDVNGRELRSQFWVINRDEGVTYKDKKTGEIKNLPAFNQINGLCMLVCSKELGDMDVEELTVNIYDYDAKKELPQAVNCFVELHGEEIQMAVQRQTVDKTKLNDQTKQYEPTGETRDQNEIIKFFPDSKLVTISDVAEFVRGLGGNFDDVLSNGEIPKAIKNMDEANYSYASTWLERNKGKTYNKASSGKSEGKPLSRASAGGETKSKAASSLFDD